MGKSASVFSFMFMQLVFRLRDWRRPRTDVLREVRIRPGARVLDYGCGTGSYVRETSRLVGARGEVYALDVNPLAVRAAGRIAARHGLHNVHTILSDCATGLQDAGVDVVLLYDILHHLQGDAVLREIRRVLRPDGMLSVTDHHMSASDIAARVTAGGMFHPATRGTHTQTFMPAERNMSA